MFQVSNEFKQMAKGIERQLGIKVVVDGVEYTNTAIVELDIENNLQQSENFNLGSIISSRLNFTIRDFDVNPSENALVEPFVRFEGGLIWNETTQTWEQIEATWDFSNSEWLPLGKFYIDNRKYTNQRLWKFECYDKTMFMHQDFVSALEYPQSMRTVLQEACYQIDLEIENIELINPDYQIYLMPTELSIHQVISNIAAANCCSAFINRNGKLQFIKFGNSMYNNPVETLTMRDYFRARQTNDIKKYTKIRLFEKSEYTEGKFVEIIRGTGDEFNTLDIENPFVDESILDDIYNSMKDFEYIPYELDYKCFPYLDLGDVITIEQSKGSTWLETKETWGTADFTWDYDIVNFNVIVFYNKIVYRGGLRSTLKAEAESVQTSEFKIKGSLREYIEKVDKSAIKEDVIYNGVKTSREEGVVVERSDKKAKTVMNATEGISIFSDVGQGLQRNFFVDLDGRIQARELDISGDATFQGTVTASSVIGGTISGTTINTLENATVGNNLYIGSMSNIFSTKGIYFTDSSRITSSYNTMDIYSSSGMDIYCNNGDLQLGVRDTSGFKTIISGSGGIDIFTPTNLSNDINITATRTLNLQADFNGGTGKISYQASGFSLYNPRHEFYVNGTKMFQIDTNGVDFLNKVPYGLRAPLVQDKNDSTNGIEFRTASGLLEYKKSNSGTWYNIERPSSVLDLANTSYGIEFRIYSNKLQYKRTNSSTWIDIV